MKRQHLIYVIIASSSITTFTCNAEKAASIQLNPIPIVTNTMGTFNGKHEDTSNASYGQASAYQAWPGLSARAWLVYEKSEITCNWRWSGAEPVNADRNMLDKLCSQMPNNATAGNRVTWSGNSSAWNYGAVSYYSGLSHLTDAGPGASVVFPIGSSFYVNSHFRVSTPRISSSEIIVDRVKPGTYPFEVTYSWENAIQYYDSRPASATVSGKIAMTWTGNIVVTEKINIDATPKAVNCGEIKSNTNSKDCPIITILESG